MIKAFIRELLAIIYIFPLCLYNLFTREKGDIVFVRLDGLGDFVVWLGTAKLFRSFYKSSNITLVCNISCADIAIQSGYFDNVIVYKGFRHVYKCFWGKRYHLLIQPVRSRTIEVDRISKVIGAKTKIAAKADSVHRAHIIDDCINIYNQIINVSDFAIPEANYNYLFYKNITGADDPISFTDFDFAEHSRTIPEDYFVVNLGGSSRYRCWPAQRYASVVNSLGGNMLCVLVGAPSETDLGDEFSKFCNVKFTSYIGKTSVLDLIDIIKYSRFVLSNDTSTVHIAAACDVKCFCFAPGYIYPRFTKNPDEIYSAKKNPPVFIECDDRKCFGCLLGDKNNMLETCKKSIHDDKPIKCIDEISIEKALSIVRGNYEF